MCYVVHTTHPPSLTHTHIHTYTHVQLDDTVLGLHPDYDSSYTPGEFSSESPCDTDGTHTVCNRLESAVYGLRH